MTRDPSGENVLRLVFESVAKSAPLATSKPFERSPGDWVCSRRNYFLPEKVLRVFRGKHNEHADGETPPMADGREAPALTRVGLTTQGTLLA